MATKRRSTTFQKRFEERLAKYENDFDLTTLNNSSDRGLLESLIRDELLLEDLQYELQAITESDDPILDRMQDVKRLSDLIRDFSTSITTLQRTLSIDRKTRKLDTVDSVAEHIKKIKKEASVFLDKRLTKIYCPNCKVMVGRFAAVHTHTAFTISIECSQCKKSVRLRREEKDIWTEIKDSEWRKKYPPEIEQPTKKAGFVPPSDHISTTDDLIISVGEPTVFNVNKDVE